jgi:hypothetical protein
MKMSDETVGIKEHKEMTMETAMCGDQKYHGGMPAAEWALKQENALAKNLRKHGEK